MKKLFSGLFNTTYKKIIRALELLILIIAMALLLYSKVKPVSMHFEADDFIVSEDGALTTPQVALPRGIYRFQLSFLSTEPGAYASVRSEKLAGIRLRSNAYELSTTSTSGYLTADLLSSSDDVYFMVTNPGTGIFELYGADLIKTSDAEKRFGVISIFILILLELVIKFIESTKRQKKSYLILTGIALLSSFPIFIDYIGESHDILFHLLRLEGLAEGLRNHTLPVKLQSLWGNGYGYAVGVFYGDILLYPAAALRLLGFSVQGAYKLYTFMINVGTVILSYLSFKKIFDREGDDTIGLFSSALYTLSIYRLINTYTRSAVGEYTAMMFLPVILVGFYMILTSAKESESGFEKHKAPIITALGLTGLIGCHVLSCEMIAFFIIITLLVFIKKVFVKSNFLKLLEALGITIVLNLGFIIPFADYFFQPLNVRSSSWSGGSTTGIQEYGVSFLQLFSMFPKATGGSFVTTPGITREVSYSIGFTLVALLIAFFVLLIFKRDLIREKPGYKCACFLSVLSVLSLFMSTCYFPFNFLSSLGTPIFKVLGAIQFPWRFIEYATVFMVFVSAFTISAYKDVLRIDRYTALKTSVILLTLITSMWYMNNYVFNSEAYRVYDTYEVNDSAFYSAEYLYEGTDISRFADASLKPSGVSVDNFSKRGTNVTFTAQSEAGGYVDLPLNYYKHYKTSGGSDISVGDNNCVRVSIPSGYSGEVSVYFKEPLLWRISEVLSVLSFLGVFVICHRRH